MAASENCRGLGAEVNGRKAIESLTLYWWHIQCTLCSCVEPDRCCSPGPWAPPRPGTSPWALQTWTIHEQLLHCNQSFWIWGWKQSIPAVISGVGMTRVYCWQSPAVCLHHLPELGRVIDGFWKLARDEKKKKKLWLFCVLRESIQKVEVICGNVIFKPHLMAIIGLLRRKKLNWEHYIPLARHQ